MNQSGIEVLHWNCSDGGGGRGGGRGGGGGPGAGPLHAKFGQGEPSGDPLTVATMVCLPVSSSLAGAIGDGNSR